MGKFRIFAALSALVLSAGCATLPAPQSGPPPVRLDELIALSKQGLGDDALVALLAQRDVAFVLSPQDATSLREAGLSDGVLRYLQGRADGDAALAARIQLGSYPVPAYYGIAYLGYPYLGYTGGLHYYGASRYHFRPHRAVHLGGHGRHGGFGGGHGQGHAGGRH